MASFWWALFGWLRPRAPRSSDAPPSPRVVALLSEMEARGRPCLRLEPDESRASRLGGMPEMVQDWPRYAGRPLSLVAQLDLVEMRQAGGPDWLPDSGRLLFFYELEHSGWGFEPSDAGCAVVRFETTAGPPVPPPADLPMNFQIEAYPVAFVADRTPLSDERLGIDWQTVSQDDQADLEAAHDARTLDSPVHRVGGYPQNIQGDTMELQCQLVTSGIDVGKAWPRKISAEQESGAADWCLLLQIDTDPAAGLSWGDTGMLYFWVREQDARAGDFSRIWAILQCF